MSTMTTGNIGSWNYMIGMGVDEASVKSSTARMQKALTDGMEKCRRRCWKS